MEIKHSEFLQASTDKLLSYFNNIITNPQSYSFGSHKGVKITKGNLTQVGSQFETTEKFFLSFIKLSFEVLEVNPEKNFKFKLLKPLSELNITGEFEYEPIDFNLTLLTINITSKPQGFKAQLLNLFIFLPPVSWLIYAQIRKELLFVSKQLTANSAK